MRREFVRNGVDAARVHVNPLFPTHDLAPAVAPRLERPSVVFLGRMTVLKGGDLLVRAVADASVRLGRAISLIAIGDGPQRARWEALASELQVDARFPGWLRGDDRWDWVRTATLAAVPSTWPEPFGLVGLEAAALGVPAIAFDVGGVRERSAVRSSSPRCGAAPSPSRARCRSIATSIGSKKFSVPRARLKGSRYVM